MERLSDYVVRKIQSVMEEKGIKKNVLAARIGKNPNWVSGKLNNVHRMSIEDLALIAAGLEIPAVDLFPHPLGIDLAKMSFIEAVSKIVEERIGEYLASFPKQP